MELADQALYAAKQAGRNRAVGMLPRDADIGSDMQKTSPAEVRAVQITTLGPEVGKAAIAGD